MEQQILQCAEELFLEKGFSLVSTTDIAKKAGCNQALVHYYFRTKENLFQQIFQAKFTKFLYIFTTFDDSDEPFTTRLRKKIEAHFDLLIENRQIPFLIVNELILNEERRSALVKNIYNKNLEIYRRFDHELQEEIQKGNIRPISTLDLLINIVSMNIIIFFMLPLLESQFNFDDEEIAEALADSAAFDTETRAQRLIDLANEHGGRDNISVALIYAREKSSDGLAQLL